MTNILILITGFGLSALAFVAHWLIERIDLVTELTAGFPIWIQILGGVTITPVVVILIYNWTTKSKRFDALAQMSRYVIYELNPSFTQIVTLSLAAGIGEELLFRGVVQPLIGIVPASIIFAGLHTGFRFNKTVLRMYFVMVFIMSLILGLIARHIGLAAAITTHAVWDFTMIVLVKKEIAGSE